MPPARTLMCILLMLLTVSARVQAAERERWETLEGGVRLYVNAPVSMDPARPALLLLYATPNGNSIEETLGAKDFDAKKEWRFDIQHVLAQTRLLRELDRSRPIVLAVTQAPRLSWPAFRQSHPRAGAVIDSVIASAVKGLDGKSLRIVLSGHSGGGSFIFGYINGHDTIDPAIERIIFLDANYAYSDEQKHGDKLLAWLRADKAHHLVVIAYDDREITLEGKKVVGPEGGTFRATGRMLARFGKEVEIAEANQGLFTHSSALSGQFQAFVHRNPDNKILHTAMVGEMNGLVHAMTLGSATVFGKFGGPRAYGEHIGPRRAPATQPAQGRGLKIPPRPAGAVAGSAFAKAIADLPHEQREAAILKEILSGNVPAFLRSLVPMELKHGTHTARCFAAPDYLAIGSDEDFLRVPMTPMTARKIADDFEASLITRKLSDDIWKNAPIQLAPKPLSRDRESVATFLQHQQIIQEQLGGLKGRTGLVAGIKKDIVLTNRLREKPNRVAIYGWHQVDGKPIQPLTIVHVDWYVDYSHGARLISRDVHVNDRWMRVEEVLKDPKLAPLLSDEGAMESSVFYRK